MLFFINNQFGFKLDLFIYYLDQCQLVNEIKIYLNLIYLNLFSDKIDWEKFSRDRLNFFIYPNIDEEQAYFDISRAFNVLNRSVHAQKAWNSNSKLALLNELIGKKNKTNFRFIKMIF